MHYVTIIQLSVFNIVAIKCYVFALNVMHFANSYLIGLCYMKTPLMS